MAASHHGADDDREEDGLDHDDDAAFHDSGAVIGPRLNQECHQDMWNADMQAKKLLIGKRKQVRARKANRQAAGRPSRPMRDNRLALDLSRRSVIAVLAAGAAVNVPAIAPVAHDTGADHPDAELLELGQRYLDLDALEIAADRHYEARCEAYQEPERSEVLPHRMEDHVFGIHLPLVVPPGCRRELSCDPKWNAFYSE